MVVRSCEIQGTTGPGLPTGRCLKGDVVEVVEREVQPQQGGLSGTSKVWLLTGMGWVPERTGKGKYTLLPTALAPEERSFWQVTDARGVPLKDALDKASKKVHQAEHMEWLEVGSMVRTGSGTLRSVHTICRCASD